MKLHDTWKGVEDKNILKFAATEESIPFLSPWSLKIKMQNHQFELSGI
jgi:hypothetical protein